MRVISILSISGLFFGILAPFLEANGRSTGPGCETTNCIPAPKAGCNVARYQACCEVWSCPDGMGGFYESFGTGMASGGGGGGFRQTSFSSPGGGGSFQSFSTSTGNGGGFDLGSFMKNMLGGFGR